ncbi:DNA-directed RNA polymerase sigma-70 factor [Streptomyces humidus]|uniref:DNA-directed RNA polymerase sigma-70 factor n=1 Tax=Streptomyces humidus TaxID=52259 RepID=A0A918G8W4_9ACTN|nr:RNA polymerase sigma-70 factor [Streptomyces humidus]GGS21571.1 DNA-directed RNA polymerase sigma-70 factor [Streptomyces humidus]
MTTASADEFEAHRPRLFGLAYRMLGSAHEAEDVVQDAYLRFDGADRAGIAHPAAWLARTVVNLCLNRLTSARARRETYVGAWLPEPVVTSDGTLGPLESAEQREAVSLAMLVLLERLTPTERAVYVLREAFGHTHREIAEVTGLSEANCRQLHRRAEQRLAAAERRFEAAPARREKLVDSFVTAARDGDLRRLEQLLAEDVTWWSDGGGRVTAALRPILGRQKVLRFLAGVSRGLPAGVGYDVAELNGAPGVLVRDGDALMMTLGFDILDGEIAGVHAVMNPDKLVFVRRQTGRA